MVAEAMVAERPLNFVQRWSSARVTVSFATVPAAQRLDTHTHYTHTHMDMDMDMDMDMNMDMDMDMDIDMDQSAPPTSPFSPTLPPFVAYLWRVVRQAVPRS